MEEWRLDTSASRKPISDSQRLKLLERRGSSDASERRAGRLLAFGSTASLTLKAGEAGPALRAARVRMAALWPSRR